MIKEKISWWRRLIGEYLWWQWECERKKTKASQKAQIDYDYDKTRFLLLYCK